jgi:hypothetical protein
VTASAIVNTSHDHPQDRGDDCTALSLDAGLVASLWGGEPTLPAGPLPTSSRMDLEHRLLLCRVLGRETGRTPSELRQMLA